MDEVDIYGRKAPGSLGQMDEVVAVLAECADDLEAEVRNRWGDDERVAHKLERDLVPVVKARALLTRIKDNSK